MDFSTLKEAANRLELSEEAKDRIVRHCKELSEKGNQKGMVIDMKQGRRQFIKVAGIAAAVCVCSAAAFAAVGGRLFYNPTIVETSQDVSAIAKDSNDGDGFLEVYSITMPNSKTPHTLEELTESHTRKSREWLSEDNIGGTVSFDYREWTSMEVIEADTSPKHRIVYEKKGATKEEYTAENPAELQNLPVKFRIDLTWLNHHYHAVPNANLYYMMQDKKENYIGEHFDFLYAGNNNDAWFSMECSYDATNRRMAENQFVSKETYDEVYYYTSADGMEFLITAYGDCIWAECTTPHCGISLYGGYLKTGEVEQILDHLGLSISDIS